MPKIAIIGAGVIGLATAWQCAKKGLSVTIFERDNILARMGNTGCSAYSLGSLVPYTATRQHDTANFQRASLGLYPSFLAELGADSGLPIHYQAGRVQLLTTKGKQESVVNDLKINPAQGALITQSELPAAYPYITPHAAPHGAFVCRDSAYVNPSDMLMALVAACGTSGVHFRLGGAVTVDDIAADFDHVIVAAGNGSNEVLGEHFQEEWAVEPMYGHGIKLKLKTAVLPDNLPLIRQGEIYLCKHGDTILLGSDTARAESNADKLPNENALLEIIQAAQNILPELKNADVQSVWRAPRPKAMQRTAPIRRVADNITLLTGHYKIGFCMTPKVAIDVANQLKSAYI